MKKSILFLGLLGSLTSCDKLLDGTPKCDDKEVIASVEELGIPKEDYWENIYNEYYDDTLKGYGNDDRWMETGIYSTKLYKQLDKERLEYLENKYGGEKYYELQDNNKNVQDERNELRNKNEEKAQKEIADNMDYIKNNYQTDATLKPIYDSYYSTKISNIRPVSSDKENKKCECEATLTIANKNEKEIHYTAQRNTDGDIYVELWNF